MANGAAGDNGTTKPHAPKQNLTETEPKQPIQGLTNVLGEATAKGAMWKRRAK